MLWLPPVSFDLAGGPLQAVNRWKYKKFLTLAAEVQKMYHERAGQFGYSPANGHWTGLQENGLDFFVCKNVFCYHISRNLGRPEAV